MSMFQTKTGSLTRSLVAAVSLALGCLLLVSTDAEAKGAAAKASFVKGKVEYGPSADGPFKKLKRKRKVPAGSFVKTGPNARVELAFPDGSVIRIGSGSLLELKEAGFNGKTKQINVEATVVGGKVWAKVSKLVGDEAKFKVKTQNAVAGVRGTIFRVNTDADKATVVKVYNGAVAVSNNPFFVDKSNADSASIKPIDKDKRQQIAAPFERISKKEWEQLVSNMMEVRIGADGQMAEAKKFSAEADKLEDPEWINWNLACDKGDCDAY